MDDITDEELNAQAEAFYSDPDNLLEAAENEFSKHMGTEFERVYAIQLIQTYIEIERPIPLDLHVYLTEACNSWTNSKGNARLVGKANTLRTLQQNVKIVDVNKVFGKTKVSSFENLNPESPESLAREYRRYKKNRENKD